ncbi:MAG: sensor histidine kinase [Clostridium sp.]
MKGKKRDKGKFSSLLIRNYIAFTLGIVISFLTIGIISIILIYSSALNWESNTPEKYIGILKSGNYRDFPVDNTFGKGSSIEILNSKGKVLFNSDTNESINYTKNEILCIPEYNKYEDIKIEKYVDYKGEDRIVVSRSINNLNNQKYQDLWVFDNKLELIYSTQNIGIKKFTQKEYDYLTMKVLDNKVVMKYTYFNNDGEINTMIIRTENLQNVAIKKVLKPFKYVFIALIIAYLIIILLFIKWLNNKVKRPLKLLNDSILTFSENHVNLQIQYSGPSEFVEIFNNFEELSNKLKQSEKENKKLQDEKQKMIADISHDLKTPITVIQAYSKAICDGIVKSENQKKYLITIYRKSELLAELINEFNDFNRIEHPDFSLNMESKDLCEFVRSYLVQIYNEVELYGFNLEIDIPEKIFMCKVDSFQLKRVLDNITSNSLKHNPKGTTLFFMIDKINEEIKITIADNGIGIPSELEDYIFEPFIVGDKSRNNDGAGLGLSISKKIILKHNGSIALIKNAKNGFVTEFEIILPSIEGERND